MKAPIENESHGRKTLTAVLFVGGLSRRMGVDKATLPFAGEPLWRRQLRLLEELNPDALVISARTRPAWCPPEVECILDEPPSRGPLGGLAMALQKARTSHLLTLAIDMPQMTAEMLHRLWSLTKPGCGVIPAHSHLLEPLCAIYPDEAAVDASAAFSANGDVSLQSFARTLLGKDLLRIHPVNERDRRCFQNVNTPHDLEACLSFRS